MTGVTNNSTGQQVNWFRFLYGGFVIASIYYVLFAKDYNSAVMNLGIALAFDPFDQKTTWINRPLWQRIWLIVHLVFVIVGFVVILL